MQRANNRRGGVLKEFHFTPRDYQLTARHEVNKHLNQKGNPILVMPTGTGKSKTSAMIISDRIKIGQTVYVIVPQIEIFNQLLDDYAFLNPGYISDEGMRGRERKLYVCMGLSLYNNLSMIPESLYPDVIVEDECHHAKASTIEAIYKFFGNALRMGMTATPVRTDMEPLGDVYDKIIEPITIETALEREYLTKPIVIAADELADKIPMKGNDFDEKIQAELLGTPQIIGDVIDTYERLLCGLPMLIACSTYDHAQKVRDSFRDAGWIAEHIHSGLSKIDRKMMLSGIAKGKINVLTTVGIGIEGFDAPGIYALAWLRRTMSTTIFVQFNGRPMRLADGKENCFILDFVGNCVIHGMPDRVRKWNLETGEEEETDRVPWKKCPFCGTYNNPENDICHWCDADISEDGLKALDGTCRKCRHFNANQAERIFNENTDRFGICNHEAFCPFWLDFPGCPNFQKKGRSLPAMIDGNLVAIDTEGKRQELSERIQQKKEEQKEEKRQEEEKRMKAETITAFEKRKVLQAGLFANGNRRSLFKEALEG